MIGVNIDNVNDLIRKNNTYLNSFNDSKNKLNNTINKLNECYVGKSLEFLFAEPQKEKESFKKISDIIENYSDILYGVKCSYQKQDQNLKSQINHINSNL